MVRYWFEHRGSFKNLKSFLKTMSKPFIGDILKQYGQQGVNALKSATPVDTGITANSWSYEISHSRGSYSITWKNSNINKGVPIAIILQYGHGTGTGGYVQGRDYINPSIRPIFNNIDRQIRKAVDNA